MIDLRITSCSATCFLMISVISGNRDATIQATQKSHAIPRQTSEIQKQGDEEQLIMGRGTSGHKSSQDVHEKTLLVTIHYLLGHLCIESARGVCIESSALGTESSS